MRKLLLLSVLSILLTLALSSTAESQSGGLLLPRRRLWMHVLRWDSPLKPLLVRPVPEGLLRIGGVRHRDWNPAPVPQ